MDGSEFRVHFITLWILPKVIISYVKSMWLPSKPNSIMLSNVIIDNEHMIMANPNSCDHNF